MLSYFIRCSNIVENKVKMNKTREHRISESSTSGNYLGETPSSPISVSSWVDKNFVDKNTTIKLDCKYITDNAQELNSVRDENNKIVPESSEKFEMNILDNGKVNKLELGNSCYCELLRSVEQMGEKDIKRVMLLLDRDNKLEEFINRSSPTTHSKLNSLKYCDNCLTLEKPLFEKFCDHCRTSNIKNFSIEVDLVCQHCVQRLNNVQRLLTKNDKETISQTEEKQELKLKCIERLLGRCKILSPDISNSDKPKSSFKCYCCPDENEVVGKENTNEQLKTNLEHINEIEEPLVQRSRCESDPMDMQTCQMKKGPLRDSTTSQDSGTEMSYTSSYCQDSTDNLSTCLYLSSQEDLLNNENDSDYASLDNENLASVNLDKNLYNSIELSLSVSNSLSLDNTKTISTDTKNISEGNYEQIVTPRNEGELKPVLSSLTLVSKSYSSTTLKDVSIGALSSSLENSGSIKEEQTVTSPVQDLFTIQQDLQSMNLMEISMPG